MPKYALGYQIFGAAARLDSPWKHGESVDTIQIS
jgi:hypothetical protein